MNFEHAIKDANRIATDEAAFLGRTLTNKEYTQIFREVCILHEDRAKRSKGV